MIEVYKVIKEVIRLFLLVIMIVVTITLSTGFFSYMFLHYIFYSEEIIESQMKDKTNAGKKSGKV